MTNPKTSPVAESVVEQVARAICSVNQADDSDWGVYLDDARAAITAMPRPIEDDTPTDVGEGARLAALIEARLLGVPFDERDLELEDQDFRLIIAALRAPTDTGLVGGKLTYTEADRARAVNEIWKEHSRQVEMTEVVDIIAATLGLTLVKDIPHG